MKTQILAIALALITFATNITAQACMGAAIRLNDDTILTAEGAHGEKESLTVEQLQKFILQGQRAVFSASGKDKVQTHRVEFLGSTGDSDGIVQSSYLVKELSSGSEKVFVLNSNYMGGGMRARGLSTPQSEVRKAREFETLVKAGCN